ncbi:hypothetical protein CP533_6284 [Ophiocordyceps camponoti-saundersi (nom. inval.)]|nr:hypothetical protein CP533_6284 [Ophiocordyceps camponoti-saundersi (nom. inval.)]
MERLSALRAEDILRLLTDEALFELSERIARFEERTEADDLAAVEITDNSAVETTVTSASPEPVMRNNGRAKRPLNAFMAFRSYYSKIFRDAQQKTASGFLTTLWHQDPFKNRWALVAKVYSFVRDEIGKDNIALAHFLSLACPPMKLPKPSVYLNLFGWTVEDDEGTQSLVQVGPQGSLHEYDGHSGPFPTTEMELLSSVVDIGLVAPQGIDLLERMGMNQNGVMTANASNYNLPVSWTREKINFMDAVKHDAAQAAKDLIGEGNDQYLLDIVDVNFFDVSSVDSISHLPIKRKYHEPHIFYDYTTNIGAPVLDAHPPVLDLNRIPENDSFDISSPFDVDEILGYPHSEGQRVPGPPDGPLYNPLEDFHIPF